MSQTHDRFTGLKLLRQSFLRLQQPGQCSVLLQWISSEMFNLMFINEKNRRHFSLIFVGFIGLFWFSYQYFCSAIFPKFFDARSKPSSIP